jgi:CRP-like cAMP-binding protein
MDQSRLRAIPLFSSLSDAEARKLATFATETSVPKDQVLIKQGDYASDLIAIEEGTADVLRDGHKLASVGPGDLIGEMGLLSRSLRTASVIATSPMRIIKLTHWDVARMSDDTVDRIKEIIAQRQEAGVADPAAPPS